jgi:hypothetical protein
MMLINDVESVSAQIDKVVDFSLEKKLKWLTEHDLWLIRASGRLFFILFQNRISVFLGAILLL